VHLLHRERHVVGESVRGAGLPAGRRAR
jgi:hypothetical protein